MPEEVPLWKQVMWLVDHLNNIDNPAPQLLHVEELRAKLIVRFVEGHREHRDDVFRQTPTQLRQSRIEELVDSELYRLAELYGDELGVRP